MARLCLAASGGGHLRQILDLRAVWESEIYLIVTEDTALGRSLSKDHEVKFVEHYAFGQAKLGKPIKMIVSGIRNLRRSATIIKNFRPDVVITTGAGAMFWTAVVSKIFGSKVILIDSFARFDAPSLFARLLRPFADVTVVQSPLLANRWPSAKVFDPLRISDGPQCQKEALLFVTVGATLAFPRMIETVLKLKGANGIPERVVMQVGDTEVPGNLPADVEIHRELSFDQMKAMLAKSDVVVCHGGTGSIITALQAGCRTIVFPRRFSLGEHYDDHQSEIGRAMAARGLVEVVDETGELATALARVRAKPPRSATTDTSELEHFLRDKISAWSSAASDGGRG